MRIASSADGVSLGEPIIVSTPKLFSEGVEVFRNTVMGLTGGKKPEMISGGIRGPLDKDKTMIISEIHLDDWVGKPLKKEFEKACGASVFLENDTAMVGMGEATVGAGKDKSIVAYMTVSTGVGGARIVNGKIDERSVGFEPGKEIIDPDNSLCPECDGNTLEDYISGSAVEKRYNMKPYDISDPEVWSELAQFLAYGLNNLVVHWSPDIVVLGGSMITGTPSISVGETEEYLKKILKVFPSIPPVVKADLGDVGGLHGALAYMKQQ